MFEADAEQIAAGTLPPAMEVKAIDDCTVEGRAHRKRQNALRNDMTYGQDQQRENAEGRQQDDEMQPPMQHAGDDDIARQARAVQEEQEADGEVGGDAEIVGACPLNGKEGGRQYGQHQQHGKGIRKKAAHRAYPNRICTS